MSAPARPHRIVWVPGLRQLAVPLTAHGLAAASCVIVADTWPLAVWVLPVVVVSLVWDLSRIAKRLGRAVTLTVIDGVLVCRSGDGWRPVVPVGAPWCGPGAMVLSVAGRRFEPAWWMFRGEIDAAGEARLRRIFSIRRAANARGWNRFSLRRVAARRGGRSRAGGAPYSPRSHADLESRPRSADPGSHGAPSPSG